MEEQPVVKTEIQALEEQLEEVLASPIIDEEDALEVASIAGLAARQGVASSVLAPAVAWRDGPGKELLDEMWDSIALDVWIEAIEEVSEGVVENDEDVEEALSDFDDVVAAAIWCGRQALVLPATKKVAEIIRMIPDMFVSEAPLAVQIACLPAVASDLVLYDFWLAVADSAATEA